MLRNLLVIAMIILVLISSISCTKDRHPKGLTKRYITQWLFNENGKPQDSMMVAQVPGNIYTDLFKHDIIADPFYGANEQKVAWVSRKSWEYLALFDYDPMPEANYTGLVFEGLDTYAEIWLNDALILESNNMFLRYSVPVKNHLKKKGNQLRIIFKPSIQVDAEKQANHPFLFPDARSFSRKAPYQYGWDWGPTLPGMGIWKPVYLEEYQDFKIENLSVLTDSIRSRRAYGHIVLDIQSFSATELSIKDSLLQVDTTIQLSGSSDQFCQIPFTVDDPTLWWPAGYGEPYLYDLTLSFNTEKQFFDTLIHYGIRTVTLQQKEDQWGTDFSFWVNEKPIYCKGANYIPQHVFPSQTSDRETRQLLLDAQSVGCNMLRVWGGGIYPDEPFFDLCDSLGILVWQDLMFACNFYPGDEDFVNLVRTEIEQQGKRISGHACLSLWCGNNEIDEAWHNWGYQESLGYTKEAQEEIWKDYVRLFESSIPAWLKVVDPSTSYIPSSPKIGWGHEEALYSGDMHYWGVWWGAEPFEVYREKTGRFMSEYGFQSLPDWHTLLKYIPVDSIQLNNPQLLSHQKHPRGMELIQNYMERDFPIPETVKDYIYVSQLVQAYGMSIAIESHRSKKPFCMGTLYWQLNDCWPVISWSGVDFEGRWKAFHYKLKRLYAPMLSTVDGSRDSLVVYFVKDGLEEDSILTRIQTLDFSGTSVFDTLIRHKADVDKAQMIWSADKRSCLNVLDEKSCFIRIQSIDSHSNEASTNYYFQKMKDIALPAAILWVRKITGAEGNFLVLRSDVLVKDLYLSDPKGTVFSDNYFDMLPGVDKIIKGRKQTDLSELDPGLLYFKSLNPNLRILLEE